MKSFFQIPRRCLLLISKYDQQKKLRFRVGLALNIIIQNLTRCRRVLTKSDTLYIFQFDIWHIDVFQNQNLTRWKLRIQNQAFKKHQNCRKLSFIQSRTKQNLISWTHSFLENLKRCINFNWKSNALYISRFKICTVVKHFFQNLTHWNFSTQNLKLRNYFTEKLTSCYYQKSKPCFLKKLEKCKKCHFYLVNLVEN